MEIVLKFEECQNLEKSQVDIFKQILNQSDTINFYQNQDGYIEVNFQRREKDNDN